MVSIFIANTFRQSVDACLKKGQRCCNMIDCPTLLMMIYKVLSPFINERLVMMHHVAHIMIIRDKEDDFKLFEL